MNLVREFYQSLALPEERDAYKAATRMSSEDRVQYLRDVFGARATEEMIQEFATASRTELMDIANEIIQAAAQETRKGFLAAIGYFFSFKWWGKKK